MRLDHQIRVKINNLSKRNRKFLKLAMEICEGNGVSVILEDSKVLDIGDGVPSSGYFSDSERVLVVAMGSDTWFEVFLHEYCHFLQFILHTEAGLNYDKHNMYELVEEWNGDIELKNKRNNKLMAVCFELEFECERMVVELIENEGLDIDIEKYIQSANCYLYFHRYMREFKVWCKTSPYNVPGLVEAMPTSFDYTSEFFYDMKPMPEEYRQLFDLTQVEKGGICEG